MIQHGSAAGNTSRTGPSSSPAAQSTELKALAKFRFLEIERRKTSDFCTQHIPDGMVDVKSGECTT